MKATITFSNGSRLVLKEDDFIVPVCPFKDDDGMFASQKPPHHLYRHVHDNLIPGIMDGLFNSNFFMLSSDHLKVYNVQQIVSIVSE